MSRWAGIDASANARWAGRGFRRVRLEDSGSWVSLDLSSWQERITYFLGRYMELDLELLLGAILREGDQLVDGGANIGLLSLYAARLVGPTGRIHAFEPNPEAFARLEEHVRVNGTENVVLHPEGLSDSASTLTLRIPEGDDASATLVEERGFGSPTRAVSVRVVRGDDALSGRLSPDRRTLVKLDLEGHEAAAIRGMLGLVDQLRPVITTEHLTGVATPEDTDFLFSALGSRGYRAFALGLGRRGLSRALELTPMADAGALAGSGAIKLDLAWMRQEHLAATEGNARVLAT